MSGNNTPDTSQLIASALRLPMSERMALVNAMLKSAENTSEKPTQEEVDASWNTEIAKRVNELKNGEVEAIPSAELWKRIGGKPNA